MITDNQAAIAARELFPDDYADGTDCRAEIGKEGEPCSACAENNRRWNERVEQVRAAMIKAIAANR